MVIGKVSRRGSFLAPYGDFNIEDHGAREMRRAKYIFTLARPDKSSGASFQADFDVCVSTVHTIVDNFREIKTAAPFVTLGVKGPSFNFSHEVFEYVSPLSLSISSQVCKGD
jgi:hypothetical protein